jgi:hypothetical protein
MSLVALSQFRVTIARLAQKSAAKAKEPFFGVIQRRIVNQEQVGDLPTQRLDPVEFFRSRRGLEVIQCVVCVVRRVQA